MSNSTLQLDYLVCLNHNLDEVVDDLLYVLVQQS